jgi:hypothetical protein
MTATTTPAAGRRRPAMIAAAAAIAAVTLAGGIALLTGGDDDLPRLELGTGAQGTLAAGDADRSMEAADDMAAGSSMVAWVRYEAGDELPDLGGSSPVYRLRAGEDDLRAIATHLGVDGDVTPGEGQDRTIAEGDASVNGYGASWWYTSGQSYPGVEGVECAIADDGREVCLEEPMPEPERPADLPTQAEAEDIIRAVAAAAGLDLRDAQVTSQDNVSTWGVNIDLAVDGTPIPGYSIYGTVMAGGVVLDAGGVMGTLEHLGDYPLDTTRAAIDRLNEQNSGGGDEATIEPAPEDLDARTDPAVGGEPVSPPQPAEGEGVSGDPGAAVAEPAPDEMTIMPVDEGDGEPIVVTLTRARLAHTLIGNIDGTETYLVPAYLLDGTSDRGDEWTDVFAMAVRADHLRV